MDTISDDEPIVLGETGIRVRVVAGSRRQPGPDAVLRALIAESASVPTDDVELVHACEDCGVRHGRVTVAYPLTPSGAPRYGDVAIEGDAIVAATGTRHPLGVAVEPAVLVVGEGIDEVALHPDERMVLRSLGAEEAALARAALWARKNALLRALGHSDFIEPSRLALSAPTEDGGIGRIERSVPEFGSFWRDVVFHDVPVPGRRAASVAVIG
ncbi:hypothetical protein [Agromyces sp. Marseille-Q5079]|uniref:hypothetical protein n=1 Tax=Agromyces sp. Marseille-Q5079 TaxID=3439059 RepID=UPI003D9CBBE2